MFFINNVDTKYLYTFIAVCEEGSITKAAERLGYVQSSISNQIAILEDIFGKKLFERSAKGVIITDYGKVLLKYAYEYINLERELMDEMNSLDKPCGTIKISTTETFCALRIPIIINNFQKDYPNISFNIETGCVHEIVNDVLSRKVDFGIVPNKPDNIDLEFIPLYKEKLVFISDISYWEKVKKYEEKDVTYIGFGENCLYSSIAEKKLDEIGIKIDKKMQFSSVETIKSIVGSKMGISLVPYENVKNELDEGKLMLILNDKSTSLVGGIICRKQSEKSTLTKIAIDFLKKNI